jgi:hypothetical protein
MHQYRSKILTEKNYKSSLNITSNILKLLYCYQLPETLIKDLEIIKFQNLQLHIKTEYEMEMVNNF